MAPSCVVTYNFTIYFIVILWSCSSTRKLFHLVLALSTSFRKFFIHVKCCQSCITNLHHCNFWSSRTWFSLWIPSNSCRRSRVMSFVCLGKNNVTVKFSSQSFIGMLFRYLPKRSNLVVRSLLSRYYNDNTPKSHKDCSDGGFCVTRWDSTPCSCYFVESYN